MIEDYYEQNKTHFSVEKNNYYTNINSKSHLATFRFPYYANDVKSHVFCKDKNRLVFDMECEISKAIIDKDMDKFYKAFPRYRDQTGVVERLICLAIADDNTEALSYITDNGFSLVDDPLYLRLSILTGRLKAFRFIQSKKNNIHLAYDILDNGESMKKIYQIIDSRCDDIYEFRLAIKEYMIMATDEYLNK